MKRLAYTLSTWSTSEFGHIFLNVKEYEEMVRIAEEKLIEDHTEVNQT